MRQLDEAEQLVLSAELSAGVLGRGGADFILFPTGGPEPLDTKAVKEAALRGFYYIGALAIVEGRVDVSIEAKDPVDCKTMVYAAASFCDAYRDHIRAKQEGDAVEWLHRLFELPGPDSIVN
jgi:hypothetical protein